MATDEEFGMKQDDTEKVIFSPTVQMEKSNKDSDTSSTSHTQTSRLLSTCNSSGKLDTTNSGTLVSSLLSAHSPRGVMDTSGSGTLVSSLLSAHNSTGVIDASSSHTRIMGLLSAHNSTGVMGTSNIESIVTKIEPTFTHVSNSECVMSFSSTVSSPTSIDLCSVKIEQHSYEDNPVDFTLRKSLNDKLENTASSCPLESRESVTQTLVDEEKPCALDYTISTLNKVNVGSVNEKSSVSHIADISLKNSCHTLSKSHDDRLFQSCDHPTTKITQDKSCDLFSVIKSSDRMHDISCDTSSDLNTNESKDKRDTKLEFPEQSKIVLTNTSKLLNNTNSLLRDTTDLLKDTSNLLNDTSSLLNDTKSIVNDDNNVINDELSTDRSNISCFGNEVTYLSVEDYKSRHRIGSRRSSENVLTYNNPVIQPYLPRSPEKITTKTVLKRKFCVDEIAEHLAKKRAVVSLGERVKETQSNTTISIGDKSNSNSQVKSEEPCTNVSTKGDKSNSNTPTKGDKSTSYSPTKGDKSNSNSSTKEDLSNSFTKEDKSSNSLKKGDNSNTILPSDDSDLNVLVKGEKSISNSPKKGKILNSSSASEGKSKPSSKTKKKPKKNYNKSEIFSFPSRRIKREASLNASARVNILYERDVVSPKSRKLSSGSSSSGKYTNKPCAGKYSRSISTESTSKISKKKTTVGKCQKRSKSVGSESLRKATKNNLTEIKSKVVKKHKNKSTDCGDNIKGNGVSKTKKKDQPLKSTKSTKHSTESVKKKKLKQRKENDDKAKKRKLSCDQTEEKVKKVKTDVQKSARTHVIDKPKTDAHKPARALVIDKPKTDYTVGTSCIKCCQHSCPQNRTYWNGKDDSQAVKDEEKISDSNSSLPVDVTAPYPVPTVQLMEGSPYVVPHGHLGTCHACAQGGGNLMSASHSYTLSGIGSLSQMMPYHQPYGGGYPVAFPPSNSTAIPHCGCPACYSATGVYYPQTSTPITHQSLQHDYPQTSAPITHQSLQHDPCLVPHPVHIPNEESEFIDVVGGESDTENELSSPVKLSPLVQIERSGKKSAPNSESTAKKKNMFEIKKKSKVKFTKTKIKKFKKKKNKDKKKLKKKIKPKIVKKPQYRKSLSKHGWEFEGQPETRKIMCHSVGSMVERSCYPRIRHIDGDVINIRDCVLLRSGPRKSDIPYVAKIKAFWEDPMSREMMMSILWYYQPEHTEGGRKPHHLLCELFASKHKDENCVACIEDKGYVLTYVEYCRFMAEQRRIENQYPPREIVVPAPEEEYPGRSKLPPAGVDPNTVYVCRQVYDFKLKRILKNPS